ncbi:MAG: hypothetical protein HY804_08890 [Nitrospinae bacterium]|nr:hypothetical protein [Nitrospinota bacterium]
MVMVREPSTQFTVTISGYLAEVTLVWPVIRNTDKAILVQTPGGEVWFPVCSWGSGAELTEDSIRRFMNKLVDHAARSGSGFVKARLLRACRTPAATWAKFKVGEHIFKANRACGFESTDDKKVWWLPRWIVRRYIGPQADNLRGIWPGETAFRDELQAAAAHLALAEEVEIKELRGRAQKIADSGLSDILAWAREARQPGDFGLAAWPDSYYTLRIIKPGHFSYADRTTKELIETAERFVEAALADQDFISWLAAREQDLKPPA